jgi:hypothetical protein
MAFSSSGLFLHIEVSGSQWKSKHSTKSSISLASIKTVRADYDVV